MELNLQNKQLRDFTDVWPYIKAPREVTSLNLRNNRLQDLPKNLSRFIYLKKIDLTQNPIKQIDFVIDGLVSLPKLKELNIDNITELGLTMIKSRLPKLEVLNGINIKEINKQEKSLQSNKQMIVEDNQTLVELNFVQLAFDCLETLYKEKNERYSPLKMLDDNIKERLMSLGNDLNPSSSSENLNAYSLKIENDVNFYVLNALATYIRTHGDDRIATLLDFIVERNRAISDTFFDIVKEKEKLGYDIKALKRENQYLKQRLDNVTLELNQQIDKKSEYKNEPNSKIQITEIKQYRIVKPMSKGNLKDLIREVLESKNRSDKNLLEAGFRLKTLKEYLYDNLNKKFGLPNLVEETIESIILGVEAHQTSDIEIFVFKLMIENKLHEQFYPTLHKIKKTLRKLLFTFIKAKYKTTAKIKFETAYENIIKGTIGLKEAQLLLFLLYNENDAVELSEIIADNSTPISSDIPSVRMLMTTAKRDYEIKWSIYEDIILRYIVSRQMAFVHNFVMIFRNFDENNSGVINETDFGLLISKISDIVQVDINTEELLIKLDPGNTKFVIFSQCLALLASLYTQDTETREELCILTLLNNRINNII